MKPIHHKYSTISPQHVIYHILIPSPIIILHSIPNIVNKHLKLINQYVLKIMCKYYH